MKCTMIVVWLVFLLWKEESAGVFGAGFHGIPGDYCRIRTPKCCPSRDDECTAPILGNHLCYCDMFCDRPDGGDCCPDFEAVCRGITPPPIRRGDCEYEGVMYGERDEVMQNCNRCTCTRTGWSCPTVACMIQPDLLQRINQGRYSYVKSIQCQMPSRNRACTWTGRNYSVFWGRTLEDGVKYRLGTLFPERSVQNMNEILIKPQTLPDQFDARENWPGLIHPVRDQGNCGSSWAFSTTATSADRLSIMSEGKLSAMLSTQQLLSCNQHRQRGCEGGHLDRAWWYIRKLGVVSDECYPYDSGRTNQPGICKIPKSQYRRAEGLTCPSGIADSKVYKMTPPYRVSSNEEDIKTEIMVNGPVQATFLVHEDFYMYSGGVYRYENFAAGKGQEYRAEGYHSVRIIGWGREGRAGQDVKYWICANSWGPNWGDNGYFKIVRGENHCEIESFVIGAWGKGSKKRRRKFKVRKVKRLRKLRRL